MEYPLAEAGLFRGNPNASDHNNLRLVAETPGTVAKDSVTIDTASKINFEAVEYAGADGVVTYIPLSVEQFPDGNKTPIRVSPDAGRDALRKAIQTIMERHEVNPIVTVTGATTNFIITHYGAGTLSGIYVDGAKSALTREALA